MSGRAALRVALAELFAEAQRDIDIAAATESALREATHERGERGRCVLVAIGKAAPAMAEGARRAWPEAFDHVLVATTDDTDVSLRGAPELLRAAHPVPDARSLVVADRALDLASSLEGRLLVVLVSGGASSLACAPIGGVSLDDKIGVTRALLASGANIDAINLVRRHLSRIKGGGLSRVAVEEGKGRVLGLVVSDVLSGDLGAVGSGPTVPTVPRVDEARASLARYAPSYASLPMRGDHAEGDGDLARIAAHVETRLVLDPSALARAMAKRLEEAGFVVRVAPPSRGTALELSAEYEALAASLARGHAVVRVAEPTLVLASARAPSARGGRAGHLAASVSRVLPVGVAFLAGASDGVDGTSGAGGAAVDRDSAESLGRSRVDEALAAFDTATLHETLGTALPGGPTGINLCDLHVIARR